MTAESIAIITIPVVSKSPLFVRSLALFDVKHGVFHTNS